MSIWIWLRTFLFWIWIRTFLFGFGSLEIPLILRRSEQSPPISCPSMIHRAKEDPNPAKNQESGPCTHLLMFSVVPGWVIPVFPPSSPKSQCANGAIPGDELKPEPGIFLWIPEASGVDLQNNPSAGRALKPNKQPRHGKKTRRTTRARKTGAIDGFKQSGEARPIPEGIPGLPGIHRVSLCEWLAGTGAVTPHPSPPGPRGHAQPGASAGKCHSGLFQTTFLWFYSLYFWFEAAASPALFIPRNSRWERNILPGLRMSFPSLFLPPVSPLL